MRRVDTLVSNIVFSLSILLLTAAVFRDQLSLPAPLQASGRLHPVLLHFPSALLLLLLAAYPFRNKWKEKPDVKALFNRGLLFATLLTVMTALTGLFLSKGDGYDQVLLTRHLWMGTATVFIAYLCWQILQTDKLHSRWGTLLSIAGTLVLVTGSHFGGSLTHGDDFLSFSPPVESATAEVERAPITDSTAIYLAAIQPLLQTKCYACHNENKSKGGLVMSDLQKMLAGGKSGAMWVAGDPDNSLIIERLLLDMNDRKHMPPKGKSQLTTEEISLLHHWIASGADLKQSFRELDGSDSLRLLASTLAEAPSVAVAAAGRVYDFKPADKKKIEALNGPFRVIYPVDHQSPALSVAFFVAAAYKPSMLEECRSISDQIVSLKLTSMPAGDEAIDVIAGFSRLETLDLNGTRITGSTLTKLSALQGLSHLTLSNTPVSIDQLEKIAANPSLRKVFLWRTKVTEAETKTLQQRYPKVTWETGYQPDASERLTLTAPFATNRDKRVFARGETFELKHPMPGITLRYTTDGTEPDSLTSEVYKKPIPINGPTQIKVIAVMEGWGKSVVSNFSLFARGIAPTESILLTQPDSRFKAQGGPGLADGLKGDSRNTLLNWLGFRETPFMALFRFDDRPTLTNVTFSLAENHGQYIMPPTRITVWGGEDSTLLTPIGRLTPEMPVKEGPTINRIFKVEIIPAQYRYIRVQADPIRTLPAWHRGKGDKGWVFVDELFFD